jgi:predicted acylesterase/phospholipase RssA
MPKRSLILAGGGLKVAYQAGVLQVWLDEANLTFDHADGASGGCFNLAMYCQGMSGTRIADNWRNLDPFLPVDVNLTGFWPLGSSLFTYDNFRRRVLPFWGIDWAAIRQSPRPGTFNLFNFSKKQLEVWTNDRMDEDPLIAAVSLPMWFPPVKMAGDTYFDAVYITDGNLEEAVRRGADEIWAIWTVSRLDEWRDGFVAQYFQIIETVADTNFFAFWKRLEANNAEIAAGRPGEFGRHIELRLIEAEVPIHYLLNVSRDRMAEVVNMGVQDARAWCTARGIPLRAGTPVPAPSPSPTSLQFTEQMRGHIDLGTSAVTKADFEAAAARGKAAGKPLMFEVTIAVPDVDQFVVDPRHEGVPSGFIDCPELGGKRPLSGGSFNLLVQHNDPSKKLMLYRLFFSDGSGQPLTLTGFKDVHHDQMFDLWGDLTTLYIQVLKGHVRPGDAEQVLASGLLVIRPEDFFFRQLFSFRVNGPTALKRAQAMTRFGVMFLGKLWDVYGHQLGPL